MNLQESIIRILKEVRVPRSERVELYKDDNIIVVVPLTHRALQKYANRCQWCINDDIGEWEDYHKGKHAVIIQRNPKKPKIGITGNPVASELFLLDKLEQNQYDLESIKNILGYQFKDRNEMMEYFQTIGNDISDFATNIVYYSPINGLFDQEDNYMWSYNMEISQIPNVTLEVIKIMDDYLSRSKNVDLQESIRRILREETYSPAGDEYIPDRYVVHKSNPVWRENIELTGLQVSVGECYQIYVNRNETDPNKIKCTPVIFATDSLSKNEMFDSTYDDDIWLIDTECANVKWYRDKHFDFGPYKHIVTFENISPECIELIYKGTGESN